MMPPARSRLPNRRPSHVETLEVAGQEFTACIGFDPETGQPRELFLNGGKEGSMLNSLLADAAVTAPFRAVQRYSTENGTFLRF